MKNLKFSTIAVALLLVSCGANSDAQSNLESLIKQKILTNSDVLEVEVLELELIYEISAKDSLKYMNPEILATNEQYKKKIKSLEAEAYLYSKARKNLYYGTSTRVNPYYETQCTNHISNMKNTCKVLNEFSEGNAYLALKKKNSTEIVAKVYRAKIEFMQKVWYGNSNIESRPNGDGTERKTEVRYFVLNASETEVTKTIDDFSTPHGKQEQFVQFDKFSVDDEGNITIIKSESNSEESNESADEKTIVAKYLSAEFVGYCFVQFEDEKGEIISFIDPDLGTYTNPDDYCAMQDAYSGKKFKITHYTGEIEVHVEDNGNEIIETEIIKKITLVD